MPIIKQVLCHNVKFMINILIFFYIFFTKPTPIANCTIYTENIHQLLEIS